MSSTMIAAHATGIPVFITGGIGGVHRDASSSELFFYLLSTFSKLIVIFNHILFSLTPV